MENVKIDDASWRARDVMKHHQATGCVRCYRMPHNFAAREEVYEIAHVWIIPLHAVAVGGGELINPAMNRSSRGQAVSLPDGKRDQLITTSGV